jgi:hypothetical protein
VQSRVDGVANFRSVEGDSDDPVLPGDFQVFIRFVVHVISRQSRVGSARCKYGRLVERRKKQEVRAVTRRQAMEILALAPVAAVGAATS